MPELGPRENAIDQTKIGGDAAKGLVYASIYVGDQISQLTAELETSLRDLAHEITELDQHLVDALGETQPKE